MFSAKLSAPLFPFFIVVFFLVKHILLSHECV
nr:MAG TPA: hypothetical protein [Crassvirales sp.]